MSPRHVFQASRADGRSDRQVIIDLAESAPPDTVFLFDDLLAALREGVPEEREIDLKHVYQAVITANKALLADSHRYLVNERGIGYRVARAEEHTELAVNRRNKAEDNLSQGLELLRQARVDELTDSQRLLHQGQLMIIGGLVDHMRATNRRLDRQERLIQDLAGRVDKIDPPTTT